MQVIVFILLKIAEIGGLIFLPYFLGKFMKRKWPDIFPDNAPTETMVFIWLAGFVVLLLTGVFIILTDVFIAANWELARNLIN